VRAGEADPHSPPRHAPDRLGVLRIGELAIRKSDAARRLRHLGGHEGLFGSVVI
jgi:hypothetical protein